MRTRILLLSFFAILSLSSFGQSPQGFQYQAVVRDATGNILPDQAVSFRLGIWLGSPSGTEVYTELHNPTTNDFGLVNLVVGGGAQLTGTFSAIDWGTGPYFLKVELDPAGGMSYTEIGSTQLLSVPYSMYALNAGSVSQQQILSISNDTLYLSGGSSVFLGSYVDTLWKKSGLSIYNSNPGNVGIGTANPVGKLVVKQDSLAADHLPLFEIKNKEGQTIFVVYPDSVHFYILDDVAKSNKGGFAVSGRNTNKSITNDYFYLNPDSTRIWTQDTVAGFGVRNLVDTFSQPYMVLSPQNYFIGHESGLSNLSGLYNSFFGYQTGRNCSNSSYNTLLGYQAGMNMGSGGMASQNNCFMGYQAGFTNTSGDDNVYIGFNSGYSNNMGTDNVFIGSQSGFSNNNGSFNVFLGKGSGYANIDGISNVFIGRDCGYENTSGWGNIFLGSYSGSKNVDGYFNVFLGMNSGFTNVNGTNNTFVGTNSGAGNVSGNYNLFIGYECGRFNIIGSNNIMLGKEAGHSDTSGIGNIFIGERAGFSAMRSINNICLGTSAGNNLTDGSLNVLIGYQSGAAITTGQFNLLLGTSVGYGLSTGSRNVFLGSSTGGNNSSGNDNVMVGHSSGANSAGSANVFLGFNSGFNESNSNRLYIENSAADSTQALIFGRFDVNKLRVNNSLGIGRTAASNNLEVNGDASKTVAGAWLANSDKRIKTDITEIDNASELLMKLHPVKFKYTEEWMQRNPSIKDQYYYNFIAQEFRQVFPEAVKGSGEYLQNESEEILQIDTYNAQIITIKSVQQLIEENDQQKKEIENLKSQIEQLNQKYGFLEQEINALKVSVSTTSK